MDITVCLFVASIFIIVVLESLFQPSFAESRLHIH